MKNYFHESLYDQYKIVMECPQQYGFKSMDFLIQNLTKEFDNLYNYSLQLNNKIIKLDNIQKDHVYYFEYQVKQILHYNSINMRDYLKENMHGDIEFVKIWINKPFNDAFHKTHLVLNMYNTVNNYQKQFSENALHTSDQTIKVTKIIHQNLKPPYGDCSDYSEDRPFNGTNQWHCYRQCLKTMAENMFDCKPVLIDKTLHELDFISDNFIECNSSVQKLFDEYVAQNRLNFKCIEFCPRDCVNIDFKMSMVSETENDEKNYENTDYKMSMVWDTTRPMLVYKEEPVMSFIDYICYCGGLVGLFFGTSAVDYNIHYIIPKFLAKHVANNLSNPNII